MRVCVIPVLAIQLLLLVAPVSVLRAQRPVAVTDTVDQHIFSYKEIEFFRDSTNRLGIDEIAAGACDSLFRADDRYSPSTSDRESYYWFRFKIRHDLRSRRDWVLEFFDQTIDHIELYAPNGAGRYEARILGDEKPFATRVTWHKNFVFDLVPHGDSEVVYYARVRSKQRADVLIVLRAKDWFFHYALDEYYFFGIFYGMILVFIFYNTLMGVAVRERQYLYYVLYLVSIALYEMSADGIGFQYLWPEWPAFNIVAPGLFLYMASMSALVFSSSVLNIRKKFATLHRVFMGVFVFRTCFLLASFVWPPLFSFRFIEILPFVVIYYASVRLYLVEKYAPARFLVMAYSFLAFGVTYKILQYFDVQWTPLGQLSHYSLGFSFILEMLFLSFAISDKIHVLKIEKEKAQEGVIEQLHENQRLKDNLNQTLEEQVRIKTTELLQKNQFIERQNEELELAYHHLEAQSQEIAEINRLLEKDNVQLQHDVAEVKEARVLSKEVSFEEFTADHPDDASWMRFLSEVKWANGYHCRKCESTHWGPGKSPYSHRCSRCGYDESVLTNTVLQNTRIPVSKALYIVFLIYNSKGTISSHRLSEIVGIRQSTCWSFGSKVKSAIRERSRKGQISSLEGWKGLLVDHFVG